MNQVQQKIVYSGDIIIQCKVAAKPDKMTVSLIGFGLNETVYTDTDPHVLALHGSQCEEIHFGINEFRGELRRGRILDIRVGGKTLLKR